MSGSDEWLMLRAVMYGCIENYHLILIMLFHRHGVYLRVVRVDDVNVSCYARRLCSALCSRGTRSLLGKIIHNFIFLLYLKYALPATKFDYIDA